MIIARTSRFGPCKITVPESYGAILLLQLLFILIFKNFFSLIKAVVWQLTWRQWAKHCRMAAQKGPLVLHGLGGHQPTRGGASRTPWAVPCGTQPIRLGPNHEQQRGEHQRRRPPPAPHFKPATRGLAYYVTYLIPIMLSHHNADCSLCQIIIFT